MAARRTLLGWAPSLAPACAPTARATSSPEARGDRPRPRPAGAIVGRFERRPGPEQHSVLDAACQPIVDVPSKDPPTGASNHRQGVGMGVCPVLIFQTPRS